MYENGYNPEPKWKEECGVYGVYSHTEDVSEMTYLGLYALQHRGQESAGIALTNALPSFFPLNLTRSPIPWRLQ